MGNLFVKYLGKSDFLGGQMFYKSVEIMKTFDKDKEYSVNEVLELYNVLLYLQDYVDDERLTLELKKIVNNDNIKKLNAILGKFFRTINNDNIVEVIRQVDLRYRECFWKLVEKFKVYELISNDTFSEILKHEKVIIWQILKNKKIVSKFDSELKDLLLSNVQQAVEILVDFYFSKKELKISLPKSLSLTDKEQLFSKYIESEHPNMGLLETISHLPVKKECLISDATRARALEKHRNLLETFFKNKGNSYISTNMEVSFSKDVIEYNAYEADYGVDNVKLTISEDWIKNNIDYATLLNNFIYILGLVDNEVRIMHISKPATFGLFERISGSRELLNNYLTGSAFQIFNKFAVMEVAAYCEFLKLQVNIRIEDVLQWFFDTYLETEFRIEDFAVAMPSAGCTYLEKCRMICIEMESVVKQYNLYTALGRIDHDIIEISSIPTEYSDIGSLIWNKYIYIDKEKCGDVVFLLFSDQALLTYVPARKELAEYDCFYELLLHEKLKIYEYDEMQRKDIKILQDEKVINISADGDITFSNINEIKMLHDIYINEFGCTNYYKKHKLDKVVNSLENRGWIYYDSHLLSKQESDYFNYYLNKSVFTNGFDLRNRYLHGTHKKRGKDEELHKMNYYTLLMLFTLLTIKINDELCVNDENKPKDKE